MSYTRGQLIEWVQSTIEQYRNSCASDKNSFQYRADLDSKVRALLPVLYRLQELETRCCCSHDTNPAPDPIRKQIEEYVKDLSARVASIAEHELGHRSAGKYENAICDREFGDAYRIVTGQLREILDGSADAD